MVERCASPCRDVGKYLHTPPSLLSARRRVASGVVSSAKSPLGNSRPSRALYSFPLLSLCYSAAPSGKNSGLHSVKRQPTRVYGQWDQTPSLTPPHLPQHPFFRNHVCPRVACLLRACVRTWTLSLPNFTLCLVFALDDDDVWLAFFFPCPPRIRRMLPQYNGVKNNYLFHQIRSCISPSTFDAVNPN